MYNESHESSPPLSTLRVSQGDERMSIGVDESAMQSIPACEPKFCHIQ